MCIMGQTRLFHIQLLTFNIYINMSSTFYLFCGAFQVAALRGKLSRQFWCHMQSLRSQKKK